MAPADLAKSILEIADLRRCPHSEITTFCGCDPDRCEDRVARLRKFVENGGSADGERQTAWAESMVGAGLLSPLGTISANPARDPQHWFVLTAEGRKLVAR